MRQLLKKVHCVSNPLSKKDVKISPETGQKKLQINSNILSQIRNPY